MSDPLHGPERSVEASARRIAAVLRQRGDEIVDRWAALVRQLPPARGLSEPLLRDEFTRLVRELADHLDLMSASAADRAQLQNEAEAAAIHAVERLRVGFDVEEVVVEYGIFRSLVFEAAAGEGDLSLPLIDFLNRVLDLSVAAAVANYARQQAVEERRRRTEAIAFVTHEMRTPLAALSSAARLLDCAAPRPDPMVLQVVQRGIAQLDRLIRQLLDESRQIHTDLAAGWQPIPVRLHELVGAVLTAFEPTARQAAIALRNEVGDAVKVLADANMLDVVLSNLVKNAIDHSRARCVTVAAEVREDHVVCVVEDDGRGIAEHVRGRIFEPYASRPGSGGSGLGLYIARRFVEAAGGRIEAVASPDGARFEVTLPLPEPG